MSNCRFGRCGALRRCQTSRRKSGACRTWLPGVTRDLHLSARTRTADLFAPGLHCLRLADPWSGPAPDAHDRGRAGVLDQRRNGLRAKPKLGYRTQIGSALPGVHLRNGGLDGMEVPPSHGKWLVLQFPCDVSGMSTLRRRVMPPIEAMVAVVIAGVIGWLVFRCVLRCRRSPAARFGLTRLNGGCRRGAFWPSPPNVRPARQCRCPWP